MDEHIIFNAFFLYSSTIFARFILASSSQDNTSRYSSTRCPDGYLTRVNVDRQLVQYLQPINARTFIHHLSGAACECSYCEVAALLPRVGVNTLPVDFLLVDGAYLVTRIFPSDANRLFDSLNVYIPSNPPQAELLIELLTLLAMALLPPVVLHRHFERHLST